MTELRRIVVQGEQADGSIANVPVTSEGHLEVAVHGPRLPFGSVHTEKLTPIIQADAVYGLNAFEVTSTTGLSVGIGAGSGSTSGANNLFTCSTGTTQYSFATIQSRRRLRYRPGQGVVGRATGIFSAPAASSIVVLGYGTSEAGVFFGYNGTSFGILHSTGGVREIHTLTITTASTATNNYNVTLPDTQVVNVTATNNGSTARTAYEIAQGTYPGWKAGSRDSTVIFVKDSVGATGGSFTLGQSGAGTPAAGSDVTTVTGVAATDTWIPQASWNGDKLDGTGPSGFTLDPSKGNVYEIGIQYLGFGTVNFAVEVASDGNNADFVTCHTLNFPNTRTAVTISQPSFPFTMAAYSAGSTTNVSVSCASFAGFIEGDLVLNGPRLSFGTTAATTSSTSAYTPIFSVRNSLAYNNRANQSVVYLLNVGGAANSSANGITTFFLVRNATLTGPTNYAQYASTSSCWFDTASTGMSTPSNDSIIWSGTVASDGQFNYAFEDAEINIQPGESVTLCVRGAVGTASCIGSLNVRENQ